MRISTSIYVYASDFFSQCTTQISKAKFIDLARTSSNFDDAAIQFQHRVLKNSGIGDETYLPRSVFLPGRHKVTLKDGREEAAMVMFGAVDDLLATTGVRLNDIKILIVNCSILNTTPSLSAMVINHYKLRHEVYFDLYFVVLIDKVRGDRERGEEGYRSSAGEQRMEPRQRRSDGYYTYDAFTAAARSFGGFVTTDDTTTRKG
ncbi:hypothetical protein HHK36_030503 [Tetracentron sinense]|uniref:FAE domain-containing protein n=1 Tax=Tetracentron sinense TaxID=13715 RepID=A0A834YCM5_TETSI|nr:hypothetical protein HHK36_030503 [Tetracentron sinense]